MDSLFLLFFLVAFIGFLGLPKGSKLQEYFKNVCIWYDQGLNVILLAGDPDETISSRAEKGRLKGSKPWSLLAYILNRIDPGHTMNSVEWDEGTRKATDTLKDPINTQKDKEI